MKWNWKRTATILMAAALMACMPVMAMAAEDDVVDEADVYLADAFAAEAEAYIGMNAVTLEGTAVTGNLDNSPAVRGDGTATTTPAASETEEEGTADADTTTAETTGDDVTPIPDTGAASMLLPIGTALLSLGAVAAVSRTRK